MGVWAELSLGRKRPGPSNETAQESTLKWACARAREERYLSFSRVSTSKGDSVSWFFWAMVDSGVSLGRRDISSTVKEDIWHGTWLPSEGRSSPGPTERAKDTRADCREYLSLT